MRYMVSFRMSGPREEIVALVPAERARVAELCEAGALEELFLAAEGGIGWIVLTAESEADVRGVFATLPMAHLMEAEFIQLRDA